MHKLPLATPARLLGAILAVCLTATAQQAKNPSASPTAPGQSKPAASRNSNDEMLARAGKLYYSSAKTGFESFDCALHPDWHTLFVSASKGSAVAEDDPRIVLLKSVSVTMHGKLKAGSTIDWNPATNADKPLDQDSTTLLNNMHTATEQTLQGFMQFWTPFVDGSAVPNNSAGLEITKTESGYTLHADTKDTKVTEQMDNQLTLTHFDVVMSQASVRFEPSYKSTDKGLLVSGFLGHILAAGAPPQARAGDARGHRVPERSGLSDTGPAQHEHCRHRNLQLRVRWLHCQRATEVAHTKQKRLPNLGNRFCISKLFINWQKSNY